MRRGRRPAFGWVECIIGLVIVGLIAQSIFRGLTNQKPPWFSPTAQEVWV